MCITVYGSNTAYTAATELYVSSTQGTSLGSIVYGTTTTLDITGDYAYIGLRSASGAQYLASVTIDWEVITPSAVPSPVFSVVGGTYYDSFKVGIAPYGTDTVVRYTLDGTNPIATSAVYSDSISIANTTTLKAIACTATDTSAVATAVYTFPVEVADIAALLAANSATNATIYKITGAVSVSYQNGSNLYVQDASGALLIYGTQSETYTNGQTLTGVCGTYTLYNGLSEFIPTKMPAAAAGTAVAPAVMTLDQISATTQNKYVKIEGVQFSQDASYTAGTAGTSANFTDGTNSLAYYNGTFKVLAGDYLTAKTYDVIAIASVYNTVQLLPISATEVVSSTPTIYISEVTNDSIPFGERSINGSYQETFKISGANLTSNILLEFYDGTQGFSVSPSSIGFGEGTVDETTITITYAPTALGSHADILNIASTGAAEIDIDLTGIGIQPTLAAPVANDATEITTSSFTANWGEVANATSYKLNIWVETLDETIGDGTIEKPYTVTEFIAANPSSGTKYVRGYMVGVASSATAYTTTPNGDSNFALADETGADKTFIPVQLPSGDLRDEWGLKTNSDKLNSYVIVTATAAQYFSTLGLKSPTAITLSSPIIKTPITGSPFIIVEREHTHLTISDVLTAGTTYKYSVVAAGTDYFDSAESNVISVTTTSLPTGLCQPATIDGVWFDGTVIRNDANLTLHVYNCQGQLIATGNEHISLAGFANGVYIVRNGDTGFKVIK